MCYLVVSHAYFVDELSAIFDFLEHDRHGLKDITGYTDFTELIGPQRQYILEYLLNLHCPYQADATVRAPAYCSMSGFTLKRSCRGMRPVLNNYQYHLEGLLAAADGAVKDESAKEV